MEKELILLDTSILIEYFRKTDKSNSLLYKLSEENIFKFALSSVTKLEIYIGSDKKQQKFWDNFFAAMEVFPFDSATALIAANLNEELKRKRKQIAIPDLFIAATAIQSGLKIVTHNKKHFERIPALQFVKLI